VRLFSDGPCFAAHALASREVAVRYVTVIRRDLIAAAGLFAGAAVYINLVEHPARRRSFVLASQPRAPCGSEAKTVRAKVDQMNFRGVG